LVRHERRWSLEQLAELPQVEQPIDIHCVTRWSKFDMPFRGVRLSDLLAASEPRDEAEFLSFLACSERRHTTSLPLTAALELGAIVATHVGDEPLAPEHGGPVRVVAPGKYFYKSIKWLVGVTLLADDRLGFWEGKAGYHNQADPWREQRYVAPNLNRMQVAQAFTKRRFAGMEFLGLEAQGIELPDLDAHGAVLRNADFSRARLAGASFEGANLSNAHFHRADLRNASFRSADVEGADFTAADLRGADFRSASLLGATFCRDGVGGACDSAGQPEEGAKIDAATRFDPSALEQLSPSQAAYMRSCLEMDVG
jgi:hypothetical protein